MSYLNTKQYPESGVQYLENPCVTSMGNESSLLQQDGMTISWDQFMNELEFE
jgi:O-succinylbenzoate synthase